MNRSRIAALAIPTSLFVASLVACTDSAGPNANVVSLSFAAKPATGTASVQAARLSPQIVVGSSSGDTIEITKAQLVLREVELTSADATSCQAEEGDDGCEEVELGPVLVELPVDGPITSPLTVAIPAGTYRELAFELHKAEDGDEADDSRDSAFLAAHPEFQGASVRVEGIHNGQPFVFTSSVNAEMELEFDTPLVVDAANNVTVNVDVSRWFRSSTGAVLAPSSANASLIAENIKASFEAFEDHNRDGDGDDR